MKPSSSSQKSISNIYARYKIKVFNFLKKDKSFIKKNYKKKLSKKKAFPPTLLLTLTTIQNKY